MTRESKDFSMREEEDGAKRIYASGMSSLFFEGILAATLAMLVGFVVSILENFDTRISVITAGTMLLGIFVIILRYTVVTVSDNELTVKYIGRKPITLARDAHGFSTLTEVKTYYLLPIWIACRTLLATDASGGTFCQAISIMVRKSPEVL